MAAIIHKRGKVPVPEVTKAAVKTNTSVQHSKTGSAVVKEQIKGMVEVPPAYAKVGVTASRTINLGEYNNVKLGVSIFFPCAPTEEAIEKTYEFCIGWVDGKMESLTKDHNIGGAQDAD